MIFYFIVNLTAGENNAANSAGEVLYSTLKAVLVENIFTTCHPC